MTKYIKEKDLNKDTLLEVANAIKKGKSVVFKTDTVYGIGTDAYNEEACKKIYEIKGRPSTKPLCVLISNSKMLNDLVKCVSPVEQKLINAFWPGPLTIKFKKKENVLPPLISAGDEFVRIRLLKDGVALALIETSDRPLVAPSANLSGNATGVDVDKIVKELDGKVDYMIDSGNVHDDVTSTIVEVIDEQVSIIREGRIKKEDIEKVLNSKMTY